ncbi:MAG TPA: TIGR02530 family flagellar biosynthesis protein [Bacillota bacterium]
MEQKIYIHFPQIDPKLQTGSLKTKTPGQHGAGVSFENIFREKLEEETTVKFSAHALKRLESRQISFSQKDLALLKDAVNRAEAKGARESLILMDQLALVVSIKNRTVITAVDGNSMKDNVFTNIDSAVIVKS